MMKKWWFALKEPVNGWTHILGAGLSLLGLILLVSQAIRQGTIWHVVSFSIYGVSLLALYTMSSLYHSLKVSQRTTDILQQLDHAMIYFLIAGTYTPMCLVVLQGGWGWTLFGINWTLAIAGMALKLSWRKPPQVVTVILFAFFIIMGWLIVVAWGPLSRLLPATGIFWLIAGGIFYTVGAMILNVKRLNIHPAFGSHEFWHVFVMAGSFCHFWVMWKYVLYI